MTAEAAEVRYPLTLPAVRAFVVAGVLLSPVIVPMAFMDWRALPITLPIFAALVVTLAWALRRGMLGAVIVSASAVEVHRLLRGMVERYDFADVESLGLGEAGGAEFVGIKLRNRVSSRTRKLPDNERSCMIGCAEWDAVLPVDLNIPARDLLQVCAVRHVAYAGSQEPV